MNGIRSRSGRSALAVVVIVCAAVFVVFGIAGSLGLVLSNGLSRIGDADWGGFRWGAGRTVSVDETKTLSLDGIDAVVVRTVSTDPRISVGGTEAVATLKGSCSTFSDPISLTSEKEGSTLTIAMKYPVFGVHAVDLAFGLVLPASYHGALSVETVSADVILADPGLTLSSFRALTVSGGIQVSGLEAGSYDLHTTSGAIHLSGATGEVATKTVSGDIEASLASAVPFRGETVSGGVVLVLPAGAKASVSFGSVSGRCTSDLPLDGVTGSERDLKGTIGGGGPAVHVETVSGSFLIRAA